MGAGAGRAREPRLAPPERFCSPEVRTGNVAGQGFLAASSRWPITARCPSEALTYANGRLHLSQRQGRECGADPGVLPGLFIGAVAFALDTALRCSHPGVSQQHPVLGEPEGSSQGCTGRRAPGARCYCR